MVKMSYGVNVKTLKKIKSFTSIQSPEVPHTKCWCKFRKWINKYHWGLFFPLWYATLKSSLILETILKECVPFQFKYFMFLLQTCRLLTLIVAFLKAFIHPCCHRDNLVAVLRPGFRWVSNRYAVINFACWAYALAIAYARLIELHGGTVLQGDKKHGLETQNPSVHQMIHFLSIPAPYIRDVEVVKWATRQNTTCMSSPQREEIWRVLTT